MEFSFPSPAEFFKKREWERYIFLDKIISPWNYILFGAKNSAVCAIFVRILFFKIIIHKRYLFFMENETRKICSTWELSEHVQCKLKTIVLSCVAKNGHFVLVVFYSSGLTWKLTARVSDWRKKIKWSFIFNNVQQTMSNFRWTTIAMEIMHFIIYYV